MSELLNGRLLDSDVNAPASLAMEHRQSFGGGQGANATEAGAWSCSSKLNRENRAQICFKVKWSAAASGYCVH
jgi:hypothetical protein